MKTAVILFLTWLVQMLLPIISMAQDAAEHAGVIQPSWTAIDIGTDGSPRGYWEYLPAAYHQNPQQSRPLLVFFHGLGEGGNGTTDLHEVLQNGPPEIANDPQHPLHTIFDDNGVILLAPQITNNTWWNRHHIRAFLQFAFSHYPVDETRIYLTGLSAGSSGIHDFMNSEQLAVNITAITTSALRGRVREAEGDYLAAIVPYWALTARGDAFSSASNTVNALAEFIAVNSAGDVLDDYPGQSITRTGLFDPVSGWQWQNDFADAAGFNPRLTVYPGSSHATWDQTYNSGVVWNWLFAQVKPTLEIDSPQDQAVLPAAQPVQFRASAADTDQNAIGGIEWRSSIDGLLGVGNDFSMELSEGVHMLEIMAVDDAFRGHIKRLQVTVKALPDLIFSDGFELN